MRVFNSNSKLGKYVIVSVLALLILGLGQASFEGRNHIRKKRLLRTPAYSSQKDLETAFKNEKKKLGLENLDISLIVVDDPNDPTFVSSCGYCNPNKIEVYIGKNNMREGVLKRVVYHAYQMHSGKITQERRWWNPYDTFIDRRATSYALEEK